MSILTAIQAKQQQTAAAYTACNSKGATMPTAANQTITNLADTIDTITAAVPINQKIQKWIKTVTVDENTQETTVTYNRDQEVVGANYTTMPASKFKNNTTLISAFIPDTVRQINNEVFSGCTNLEYVNLENITNIRTKSFYNCTNLKIDVSLPNLVQSDTWVLNHAFAYSGIVSVSNLGHLTRIQGDYTDRAAFYHCVNLKSVILPETITTICGHAFNQCSSLTTINFPESITSIGGYAFLGTQINNDNVYLPNLTYLGPEAFYGTKIKKISSLGSIDCTDNQDFQDRAFFGNCTELTEVALPNTMTQLRNQMFRGCTKLTTINLPQACKRIGGYTFYNCSSLASLDLSYVEVIQGQEAFAGTKISVINAQSLTTLTGHSQFRNMQYLTTVTSLGSITSLPNGPNNYDGEGSFVNCTSLVSVTLPNTLVDLGKGAFYNDSALTTINLNNVQVIGQSAFRNCSSLNINVSTDLQNVTTLSKSSFSGVPLTGDLHLPSLTSTIPENCFTSHRFTKISDLGQTTAIGYQVFWTTSGSTYLKEVVIPDTVTTFGSNCFQNNTGLTKFTCLATTPPTYGSNMFQNTNNTFIIYVPVVSVSAYQSASGWSSLASRIQAIPT